MAISVVMPALEMAQETGKLISWLKKEGEPVAKGEPLLEVETDKAVMEVESPADGVLAGVKVQAGAEVPVGRTIAWIVKPGETAPTEEAYVESGRKASARAAVHPSAATTPPQSMPREIKISPKARRLASEKGVDPARVHGSGPAGEILAADILAAADSKPAGPTVSSHAESMSPVARLMAERTTQSWTTVPHFFLVRELDASALNQARQQLAGDIEKSHGVKLTHSDLLVALVARVLAKHPRMNASWTGDAVRPNGDVNISLAMAVNEGVVAPVIPHADRAGLGAIAVQRRELAERARANKLRPSDLAGGNSRRRPHRGPCRRCRGPTCDPPNGNAHAFERSSCGRRCPGGGIHARCRRCRHQPAKVAPMNSEPSIGRGVARCFPERRQKYPRIRDASSVPRVP